MTLGNAVHLDAHLHVGLSRQQTPDKVRKRSNNVALYSTRIHLFLYEYVKFGNNARSDTKT